MARVRSPNYPQISLPDAIAKVALVFAKERQHAAPKEVVMKHLGYSSINGSSLGTLSGVAKYGLLERVGEDYRVSDRALTILYPPSDADKAEALRQAAMEPALFAEIFQHFGGVLPSDDNLHSYLIRAGFGDSGASAAIRVLRETMQIVTPSPEDYTGPVATSEPQKTVQAQQVTAVSPPPPPPPMPEKKALTSNDWKVGLTTDGIEIGAVVVDQEAMERFISILQTMKTVLPQKKAVTSAVGGGEDGQAGS